MIGFKFQKPGNEKGASIGGPFASRLFRIFGLGRPPEDALFRPPITFLISTPSHTMSGYFDYQGVNSGHLEAGPSSFVRPLDLADRRSGATSISRNSRASGASGLTYATNGSAPVPDDNRQSPAEPIRGMPTPVMSPRGLRLRGEERYEDDDDDDEEDIEEEEEEEEDRKSVV